MSLIFWNIRIRILKSLPVRMSGLFCLQKKRKDWKPQPWISIILLSAFSIGMSCISFGMISRFHVWFWNINFRLYWPPLILTVCYLLLTISNIRLCLQSCILRAWGFLKWSIFIMMTSHVQICRSMSGMRKTGWTAIPSSPSVAWISLHNTGLRKVVPVASCFRINLPVIT